MDRRITPPASKVSSFAGTTTRVQGPESPGVRWIRSHPRHSPPPHLMHGSRIAFLEHIGGPVHIVGWSDGGIVGLLLALRRPDLVGRLWRSAPTTTGTSCPISSVRQRTRASVLALCRDTEAMTAQSSVPPTTMMQPACLKGTVTLRELPQHRGCRRRTSTCRHSGAARPPP